jgi:hypothetical protein
MYRTFSIWTPPSEMRPATCADVDCGAHRNGFMIRTDPATELGARQAKWIRANCVVDGRRRLPTLRRRYVERVEPDGAVTFVFPAGQRCFKEHERRVGDGELFVVRPGDWRVRPRRDQLTVHTRADLWQEQFAQHQDGLAETVRRG